MTKDLTPAPELARLLGVSPSTLRRLEAAGVRPVRPARRGRPGMYDQARDTSWVDFDR